MTDYDTPFITLEGIDKSGKTTVIERLQEELEGNVVFTQEPSDGVYGKLVREQLSSDNEPSLSDFFLFLADRYDHLENTIKPALEDEEVDAVISDRYHLSTLVYQSPVVEEALNLDMGEEYIESVTSDFVLDPDLCVLINVTPEESMSRMESGEEEKYETLDRLSEAYGRYFSHSLEKDYVTRVGGNVPPEETYRRVKSSIDEKLGE